jgi:hypothetical protein
VAARREFIKKLNTCGWALMQKDMTYYDRENNYVVKPIPAIHSMLGDQAYFSITIIAEAPPGLIEEAHDLFPEAIIGRVSDGNWEQIYPKQNSRN